MDVIGDLVTRERRSDDPALVAPRENRRYDYHRFCTTAWKTGNFWRRRGVHDDSTVAIADDPVPETIFSFLGAALLGARSKFGYSEPLDARVVVAHRDEIDDYEVRPGSQQVAYGGPPDDPGVAHFERDVWSENPAFPETAIDPESVALVAGDECESDGGRRSENENEAANRDFTHGDLLSAARNVADDWALEPGDEVAVRSSLSHPGTVVAGVLAPLLAGAAILLPDENTPDGDATGDFAVAEGDAPESAVRRPADVRVI